MIKDLTGLIKNSYYKVLFFLIFVCTGPVFPQNKPVPFAAEIASIEKKLSNTKLPPAERKNALETMARLLELSGNIEKAAETWEKAAYAVSGNAGHVLLVQSARCFAAIGEFVKAEAALRPVLSASGNRNLLNKARLLSAQVEALNTGNTTSLNSLLANADFAGEKPVLYYSIWKISADSNVQSAMASRLLSEFPQSPEARIIGNDSVVSAVPAALWLLSGSGQYITATVSAPEPAAASGNWSAMPVLLQTGLFSQEVNAGTMANKLHNAGFSPVLHKKSVNGKDHWIVGVPPGPDPSSTMRQLKDKGFESFPVY